MRAFFARYFTRTPAAIAARMAQEAAIAALEHTAAAEHHAALARMYTQRAARLRAQPGR